MTRAWLLVLQLPLLFIPGLFLGLVTYGSNFKVLAGEIYIVMLIGLPVLAAILSRWRPVLLRPGREVLLLASAALSLAVSYQPLHLGYWDEASVPQAVRITIAAALVLLTSYVGTARIGSRSETSVAPLARALLCCAIAWLPSIVYPLFPLLACALINLLALTLPATDAASAKRPTASAGKGWLGYGLFLASMEFFLVALDYQGETRWALHLALGVLAACGGAIVRPVAGQWLIGGGAVLAALLACAIPELVLSWWHSAAIGLALGWLIRCLVLPDHSTPYPQRLLSLIFVWVAGMLVALLFYSNLIYVQWRAVLLVPLLWWLLRHVIRQNDQPRENLG